MSSPPPSLPVSIGSPRRREDFRSGTPTPTGSPDIRALRAQLQGTPPIPNIPARYTPVSSSYSGREVPLGTSFPTNELAVRPPFSIVSGMRPSTSDSPRSGIDFGAVDLDNLPGEEKARILRRHLVLPDERQSRAETSSMSGSDREEGPSASVLTPLRTPQTRESSEAFPIPYDAHGADITLVILSSCPLSLDPFCLAATTSISGIRIKDAKPHVPGPCRMQVQLLRRTLRLSTFTNREDSVATMSSYNPTARDQRKDVRLTISLSFCTSLDSL